MSAFRLFIVVRHFRDQVPVDREEDKGITRIEDVQPVLISYRDAL